PSPCARPRSWRRAGRHARCAAFRWTAKGTSARGRTVTAAAMLEPKRAAPDDDDGEQAALDLLANGELEIEGRLVDASNATLYCTIRPPGTGSPPRGAGPGGSGGTGSPSPGGPGGPGGFGGTGSPPKSRGG